MTQRYDALVLGLGAMGSAALYHLAGRGRRVLGIDRYEPPHDRGSTHGESRMIRQAYFEDPAYVPLLLRAYELWEGLERETAEELLLLTGGLMIGRPDSPCVAGSLRSAREHGLPYEWLEAADLGRRFPELRVDPDEVALYEQRAGLLFPERCVRALLERAVSRGAEARFNEAVLSWEAAGDGVRVRTSNGVYEADSLVVAAGPWAPELLHLQLPLRIERQIQFWFEPLTDQRGMPVFFYDLKDGRQLCGFPAVSHLAGGDRVGGAKTMFHHGGETCTPETIRRQVTPEEDAEIRAVLAARWPAMNGRLVEARTCMYTDTPDLNFVLGLHPDHPQVAVASGFSGHGFKFAPAIGEVLAELVTERSSRQPIAPFDPRRLL